MTRWLPVSTLLLSACGPGVADTDPGTSVGNPNPATVTMRVATDEDDEDWQQEEATLPLEEVQLDGCDGTTTEVWTVDQVVDLTGDVLEAPPNGSWCSARWVTNGNVVLAERFAGASYRFELESPVIVMDGRWDVSDEDAFVAEFGRADWLSAFEGRLLEGRSVDIGPGDVGHDVLRAAVERRSALFRDSDRDGRLSDDERRLGELLRGVER